MGTIRPVITDFSAGEVSPRLAGRTDSPIYGRSAKELTNFIPGRLGGIYRRGGFQHIIDSPFVDGISGARVTGKLRLIPWSVNDTLDFLLVLSNGRIDILNVSTGTTPAYVYGLRSSGTGSVPDIIDSMNASSGVYAETLVEDGITFHPIDEVKYAQSIRQVFFAHNKYPLFQIKFVSYNSVTMELKLEYGTVALTGNVAWTPELKAETIATTDPFTAQEFIGMFGWKLPSNGTSATAVGFINGRAVASIQKNVIAGSRSATIRINFGWDVLIDATISNGSSTLVHSYANKNVFTVRLSEKSGSLFTIPYGATYTAALDIIEANKSLIGGNLVYMGQDGYDPPGLDFWYYATKGSVSFNSSGAVVNYTVNFATGSPITIDENTTGLTGYVTCLDAILNKNVTPGDKMADRLSPWMTPGKIYTCDQSIQISGITPERATRFDGTKVYGPPDDNGVTPVISDSSSFILVEGKDSDGAYATTKIQRGDAGVTGQLGVILTPFWSPPDYPGFVAFHQGRLVLGGSSTEPNVLYLSDVNVFTSFKYFEEVLFESTTFTGYSDDNVAQYTTRQDIIQQIGSSNAIRLQLATEENEKIEWATSVSDLVIGTATSEWVIPAGITALDARVILTSRSGSKGIQGRFVNGSVIFVSRSGKKISAFTAGSENTQDITEHAEHIAKAVVTGFDFRQDPRQELYAVLNDGTMLVGQILSDLASWSRVRTRTGDLIKSVACLAAYDEDAVYCSVQRTIAGATSYHIERMYPADEDSFATRRYLDYMSSAAASGLGVIGEDPASSLYKYYAGSLVVGTDLKIIVSIPTTGYSSYGRPVIAVDGTCSTYYPDDQGEGVTPVAIPIPASCVAHIGFPYTSRIESFRIDASDTEGLDKSAGFLYLRLYKSGDLHILRLTDDGDSDSDIVATTPVNSSGTRIYPYSGTLKLDHLGPSRPDQTVIIEARGAEPAGIQVIAPAYSVSSLE